MTCSVRADNLGMTGADHVARTPPRLRLHGVPVWSTHYSQAAKRATPRLRVLTAVLHTLHMLYYDGCSLFTI